MLEATMENYQLQRTNDAKDAFLACMSHEMRTPLNGLLGMLQLAAYSVGHCAAVAGLMFSLSWSCADPLWAVQAGPGVNAPTPCTPI